jgi:hypothetical protein
LTKQFQGNQDVVFVDIRSKFDKALNRVTVSMRGENAVPLKWMPYLKRVDAHMLVSQMSSHVSPL